MTLAYNKDNQEDKEPLFDTVDTLTDTLAIYADMLTGVTVKPDAMRAAVMQGFATATDLADYLVKKGVPFRDAHEVVARAVRAAETSGRDLADLPLAEMQAFNPLIAGDVYAVLTLEGSLAEVYAAAPGCPDPRTFLAESWGALAEAEQRRIEAHAERCPRCAAERDLARAFDEGAGADRAQDADLDWVVTRLERARPATPRTAWRRAATCS